MGRILAIDYGTKRVGVAVTDPMQLIATALTTVHAKDIISFLKEYLAKEQVECIVVGKPMRMDGSDSESAPHVEKFISSLAKNFPDLPVKRIDERLTSRMAKFSLVEMGLKKKDRQKKENLDQVSAVLILQTYLEQQHHNLG